MDRGEIDGTKLPEAIKFAERRKMPVWSSSNALSGNPLAEKSQIGALKVI
jgi:hypothetical protein